MKCAMIIYNSAIDDIVRDALKGIIDKYSIFDRITGKGKNSTPHFGDNIWPATNKIMISVVEDEVVNEIKNALAPIKNDNITEGLKLFVYPVEELI